MKVLWKKLIFECLNSTEYCSVATVDSNGVWSNPVYFAWDQYYNFYFLSQPQVRHMENIRKDGRVSLSIYSTKQEGDFVKGIQMEGVAHVIENDDPDDEFFYAQKTYYARTGDDKDGGMIVMNNEWSFVKIVPQKIYYFNNEIFGEERQEVPLGELR